MRTGALAPYERALLERGPLGLRTEHGDVIELDVARWLAPPDAADGTVVDRCVGPVLDIGCGPGRFVSELAGRGVAAMGVDIAETAVALTRGLGFPALLRNVFDQLPGEGRWPTILLMDGNIGIGGDPARLLRRIGTLLAPDGQLVVETDPDPVLHSVQRVRFVEHGVPVGPSFDWARVGIAALLGCAAGAGYEPAASWEASGRSFSVLRRRSSRTTRTA